MDGGGSNSTSSMMMAFGDNSNGLCPMIMMMMLPHITSTAPSHHQYPNVNAAADSLSNTPFSVLPSNNNNINLPDPNGGSNINSNSSSGWFLMDNNFDRTNSTTSAVRAKIMAHPHYHRLLAAYANCQKVGAPPLVVARLDDACASAATMGQPQPGTGGSIGEDPALDQFMEAYCEILIKYEQELSKPFKEAMLFLQRVECQFKALTISSPNSASGDANDRSGSSEEEVDVNKNSFIDPQAEDEELKGKLLRRYSGYLGSLKQEFMKKRKKGKLPKEARQQLLDWWSRHYKWPYPSESQKLALAESTGLDQKQINNWFINQRKRHWKPSEDMQFMATDANHPHYYIDNIMGSPFPMDFSPTLL